MSIEGVSANPYEYTFDGIYLRLENPHEYSVISVNGISVSYMTTLTLNSEYYVDYFGANASKKDHIIKTIEFRQGNYEAVTQEVNRSLIEDIDTDSLSAGHSYKCVYTEQDFLSMSSDYYLLMNDLDFSQMVLTTPIQNFRGHFNGNGHTIRGITSLVDIDHLNSVLFSAGSVFDVNFTETYLEIGLDGDDGVSLSLDHILGHARMYNCNVEAVINLTGKITISGDFSNEQGNSMNLSVTDNGNCRRISHASKKIERKYPVELTDDGLLQCNIGQRKIMFKCYNYNAINLATSEGTYIICDSAFANCSNLTKVEISDNVDWIKRGVFSECSNLETIVIPKGLRLIQYYSFDNCDKLKEIFYKGQKSDWATLYVDKENNEPFFNAVVYFYSETEPELNADGSAYDGNYWRYNENNEVEIWTREKL